MSHALHRLTSFNSFQWDLNYDNPDLFVSMVEEMLYVANCGVDVLRFDAVAFIWKRLAQRTCRGTLLIQAFNLACRISAPAVVFKSSSSTQMMCAAISTPRMSALIIPT